MTDRYVIGRDELTVSVDENDGSLSIHGPGGRRVATLVFPTERDQASFAMDATYAMCCRVDRA